MNTRFYTALIAFLAAGFFASPARAQFEVKGLGVEKGEVEMEYQADGHFGQPARRFLQTDPGPPAEFLFDENEVNRQRHSIELGFGLTDNLQISVGAEFEQERVDDPDSLASANGFGNLQATSIQFEGTWVVVPLPKNGLGFGLYGQLEPAIQAGDANHFSVGPIVSLAHGPWSVTVNPWLGHVFGGEHDPAAGVFRDERWSFEYAWQAAYQLNEQTAIAVEGYGIVNRIGSSGRPSDASLAFGDQDQHRIGPVIYYTFEPQGHRGALAAKGGGGDDTDSDDESGPEVTMSLGILIGLNDDTSDAALKWGMGVEF